MCRRTGTALAGYCQARHWVVIVSSPHLVLGGLYLSIWTSIPPECRFPASLHRASIAKQDLQAPGLRVCTETATGRAKPGCSLGRPSQLAPGVDGQVIVPAFVRMTRRDSFGSSSSASTTVHHSRRRRSSASNHRRPSHMTSRDLIDADNEDSGYDQEMSSSSYKEEYLSTRRGSNGASGSQYNHHHHHHHHRRDSRSEPDNGNHYHHRHRRRKSRPTEDDGEDEKDAEDDPEGLIPLSSPLPMTNQVNGLAFASPAYVQVKTPSGFWRGELDDYACATFGS